MLRSLSRDSALSSRTWLRSDNCSTVVRPTFLLTTFSHLKGVVEYYTHPFHPIFASWLLYVVLYDTSVLHNSHVYYLNVKFTTLSNGYLGSRNDEERSEMRYVMRIAEFSESSNLWTQIALLGSPRSTPLSVSVQPPLSSVCLHTCWLENESLMFTQLVSWNTWSEYHTSTRSTSVEASLELVVYKWREYWASCSHIYV
jgi:hypothetical protein